MRHGYMKTLGPQQSPEKARAMTKVQELEDWRRTHYSSEIGPQLQGKKVLLFGWVASLRKHRGIMFIILVDKEGEVQIAVKGDGGGSRTIFQRAESLKPHTAIGVKGVVKAMGKAPHGAEVVPSEIRVLSPCTDSPPFTLYDKTLPSIDKRLDLRAVDLRRPTAQAVVRVRCVILQSFREFLQSKGYIEVNTPKIIATATEGGAALFPLLYYNKEAFLTQSPQLYKEELVMALEKVFEFGPAFRAERSRTLTHLSEFTSIDVEEAYVDYGDIMNLAETMITRAISEVKEKCKEELRTLGASIGEHKIPFRRLTYDEALDMLEKEGTPLSWGEDISTLALRKIREKVKGFYFIVDWPTVSKPFYIKPKKENQKLCEAFDLMFEDLELASGGSRISSRNLLEKRLKEKGLNPKNFEYHLTVFDYGMPPHAGFGMGLERLIMVLTGIKNVREASFFPRDQYRLTP